MANEKQIAILRQGSQVWNDWLQRQRDESIIVVPDLFKASIIGADLPGVDLRGADLEGAILTGTNLCDANLHDANMVGAKLDHANLRAANLLGAKLGGASLNKADLRGASLMGTDLRRASLCGAEFWGADLRSSDLRRANLLGANLSGASLYETILADVDLCGCEGLEECEHLGPSVIDPRTLQLSGPLPLAFLRGVGLPDSLIDYLPSLLNRPIQFYSCFISYSSKDQEFVERLYADLQAKGVRCWFAPHDMPIGAKMLDAIDEAIRLRDKVLLVLSEGAIQSDWVEGEVTRSLDEERERKRSLLFPIRIDNTVLETKEGWARLLRGQRNIGDFTRWKEHDAYSKGLEKLLRDLKVAEADKAV